MQIEIRKKEEEEEVRCVMDDAMICCFFDKFGKQWFVVLFCYYLVTKEKLIIFSPFASLFLVV